MEQISNVTAAEIWFGLGCALIIAEMLVLGLLNGALLVAGLSFMLVAFLTHLYEIPVALQLVILAVSLCTTGLCIKWLYKYLPQEKGDELNDRESQMIGKAFHLNSAIEQGLGDIKVGDALYTVNGPDAPAGTLVRITAKTSMIFTVEIAD